MNLSPTRLRLIRSVGLLIMLAVSVAGFMLLIDLLADIASQGSGDLLAETESDAAFISLPSSTSLFTLGVAAVAIIVALAVIAAPSNWRRSGAGLPRPRWPSLAIAASIALTVGAAGLFLALADSSPLFQQQVDAGPTGAEQVASGHRVYGKWIAPIGIVILAAFFFSVILIGFLRPRLILPVLAVWLVASLFFGFFSSGAIAGLSLFDPLVTLKTPDAFAAEVAKHRTADIPPFAGGDGVGPGIGDGPSDPDETGTGDGGIGEIGQDAQGKVSEEALIARLNDARDLNDRADAAEALPQHGSDKALRALASATLYDPSQLVRDTSLEAIGEWDFETLVEILQEHPEADVRRAAAAALGRLRDSRAVEPLATALLTDEAAEVREESAKALSKIGDPEAVSALIQSLREDEEENVRAASATALGVFEDELAIQRLLEALEEDHSALVREAAAEALGRINSPIALSELDSTRAGDESQDVRHAAAGALNRYTLDEISEALLTAVSADDRVTAAKIPGERKNPDAIPALIQALDDEDAAVRSTALDALSQIGNSQELESGNSLLSHSGGVSIIPGTTTQRSSGLPHTPVFVIDGAVNTDFLRTAVGDVYTGVQWLSNRGENFEYQRETEISHDGAPGSPIAQLDSLRLDEPTMRPASAESYLPTGIVPTGHILETASVSGIFRRHSATFLTGLRLRQYSFTNRSPLFDDAVLRAAAPARDVQVELPESVPNRVHELARQVSAGNSGEYAKAKAIEQYLRQNYTYRQADESTPPIPADWDPVDWFLFQSREGTCGNFSSAFVVLAQSIGLPARVLSGFMITPTEEEQIVFADQAHQRAEIAFEGLGWISFEPTASGQGAPGRAAEYFEAEQAENSELKRLRDLAAKFSESNDQQALRELQDAGARVHTLENGSRLISLGAFTLATPPGTTADQGFGLLHIPVFTVTGAQETEYLVTATGDIYSGEGWRQLDPVALDYNSAGLVPDLVRDSFEEGREPWSDLPESRIEPILLAPGEKDFDNGSSIRIRVAPIDESGRIPAGVVPVSRHLSVVGLDGSYRPFSGTFEMSGSVLGYEWWSILARPTESDLNRARSVEDPTYTQLPDDLDDRIHDLARRITSGHRTPYAKARAIESYLSSNYKYVFGKDSDKPSRPAGFDAVSWFLFETREGTCGNFSSAFTVLARSAGLSARVVSGWMITGTPETQTVYADQGHQWAEVAFEGIGWITLEATASGGPATRAGSDGPPDRPERVAFQVGPAIHDTETNITSWSREVERGRPFMVGGTVRTEDGLNVTGIAVEIFVNEIKANGGLRVGSGMVENGRYSVKIEIPPSLQRGKYQLIAHAIGNESYLQSWSDPDITVFSESGLVFSGPQEVDVGTEAVFHGKVTEDSGAGVGGIPLSIIIDGRTLPQQMTASDGSFSFSNTFLQPGRHWAEVRFPGSNFVRANSARLNLDVVMPTTLTLAAPVQVRVDEPFGVTGELVDFRGRPLEGDRVTLSMGGTEEATVTVGADGSFTHEFTLPDSGQVTVTAAYAGAPPILASSASSSVLARDVTVLSFEGPLEVLIGEPATFLGTVTSPTVEELEPLMVEIVNEDGEIITTIQTSAGGEFLYDAGSLQETGTRSLMARVPEQQFLTSSAVNVAFSVVHPTMISLDGPPAAMVGQNVAFSGSLLQANGQPVPNASVLLGVDPVITAEDGTFTHVITMPEALEGASFETQIGIGYEFDGTDHLASTSGSRSIIVRVPRLTAHMVAVALDDVKPGRIVQVQAALYDETGASIPGASLRTSTGLNLITDEFGQALFELTVPQSESLLAVPVTFTYEGDARYMPLNYFLGVPVTPDTFNWLLWVGLPALLFILGASGFGLYRLRAAGIPLDFRPRPAGAIQAVAEPALSEENNVERLPEPLRTSMELTIGGPGTETGNVYGLNEEIIITGRLISEDGVPVQGRAVELLEPHGDVAMFDTDESGEWRLVLRADERGGFTLSTHFAGDAFNLQSSASTAYRVVDFREEMVRLFGEFMEWAGTLGVGVSGQSPRETESILVAAGVPIDQRALDELVTRFEEADYSEHEIARRHYEAMYRAWRTVLGE